MGFRVLKPGMQTTIQDLGRYGYQSQGISVSGAMDVRSFKIANLLLDNPENEAELEICLIGPTLKFTSATIIAITGGDFSPTINGKPAPLYTAIYVEKDDVLKFASARTGSRCYVAFSSYLDVPVVMGSRSTNMKSKTGGYHGRPLREDDYVGFRIKRRYLPFFLSRHLEPQKFDETAETLRVVMGILSSAASSPLPVILTAWAAVWTGPSFPRKTARISFPTVLLSALCRCRATENPSSCFPTARPPEATRRSRR